MCSKVLRCTAQAQRQVLCSLETLASSLSAIVSDSTADAAGRLQVDFLTSALFDSVDHLGTPRRLVLCSGTYACLHGGSQKSWALVQPTLLFLPSS
jgi:hypothetical protein